jgi:hypothetical protein
MKIFCFAEIHVDLLFLSFAISIYNFVTTLFEAVFIGTEYSRQGADGLSGNTPQGMRRSADFQNIQVTRA